MGRFAAVFIGVLFVGEDGGENARTTAFQTASEARRRNQFPKLGAQTPCYTQPPNYGSERRT